MTGLQTSLRPVDVRILVVSGLGFALVTADVVVGGYLSHLDTQVRDGIQPQPSATASWMGVVAAFGEIGIAAALMAISGLVAAHARWRIWPLVLAAGNFVAVEALVYVAKVAVGRPGPGVLATSAGYPGYFPSGHSATAAVSAGTVIFLVLASSWVGVSLENASSGALAGGLLVGAVTAVRAVLGDFHWASDGLGGLAVAAIVLTLGFAMARAMVGSALATTSRSRGRAG